MRIKLFSAIKNTNTSEVIPIQNVQGKTYIPSKARRYRAVDGSAFGLQVVRVGAEAGGITVTITYEITMAYDYAKEKEVAPLHTPSGASDIKTAFVCNGSAGTSDSWSFSPPVCEALDIVMTFTGALTNGLDVYLLIWE